MHLDAPFLFLRDFLSDLVVRPRELYRAISHYQNYRSYSFPAGNLPLVDIFELVPDAAARTVRLEGIFEIPLFSRHFPEEKDRYTASTSLADSYALALLAGAFVQRSVLEVGTSFGESALLFALNTPVEARIITLDIQTDNPTVGMRFKNHPLAEKITQKISTLAALQPELEPHSQDLIFIDGDHSYAGVMEDTRIARTLLRPGGLLLWHDYAFRFRHDVVRALDEWRGRGDLDIRKVAYTNLSAAVVNAP